MLISIDDTAFMLTTRIDVPGRIGIHLPCSGELYRHNVGYESWALLCEACCLRILIPNVINTEEWFNTFLKAQSFLTCWAFQRHNVTQAEIEFVTQRVAKESFTSLTELHAFVRDLVDEHFKPHH